MGLLRGAHAQEVRKKNKNAKEVPRLHKENIYRLLGSWGGPINTSKIYYTKRSHKRSITNEYKNVHHSLGNRTYQGI